MLWFSWGTAWCSTWSGLSRVCTSPCSTSWPCWPHWPTVCGAVHRAHSAGNLMGDHSRNQPGFLHCPVYFIHGLSFMESSVLLTMAFDRYIAICNPLRYSSILTNDKIMKIGVAILCGSSMLIPPVIIRLKFLNYCHPHILSHSFCLHQDLIRMACSDIRFNSIYGLALVISNLLLKISAHHYLLYHDLACSLSNCITRENQVFTDLCISSVLFWFSTSQSLVWPWFIVLAAHMPLGSCSHG